MNTGALRESIVIFALLVTTLPAAADWSVDAHAFSELVHRGASLNKDRPAVGLTASHDWRSGAFAGASGFFADRAATGAALNEYLRIHAGWFSERRAGQALELSLAQNVFPSASDWSYVEARVDYHLSRRTSLMLALSPDYYGRDAPSLLTAVFWRPRLTDSVYALLTAGAGYLAGSRDAGIGWGEVGIGFSSGRFDVSASFNAVDSETTDIFRAPRQTVAARVSYRLY